MKYLLILLVLLSGCAGKVLMLDCEKVNVPDVMKKEIGGQPYECRKP